MTKFTRSIIERLQGQRIVAPPFTTRNNEEFMAGAREQYINSVTAVADALLLTSDEYREFVSLALSNKPIN